MKFNPYKYQQNAIEFIEQNPFCALFLDMGLGKTVVTLTAIKHLMEEGKIKHVLVVAPKLVAENTWNAEIEKWEHTKNISYSIIAGTEAQRETAVKVEAQIYIIGRDNFRWLVEKFVVPFYDMIVLDELTSFKNRKSFRWHAMKKVRPFMKRVVGLTGTPIPNGLKDLWGQMYCLDQGARLERTQTRFYNLYFNIYVRNYAMLKCELKPGAEEQIREKIKDITLSMQAKDYLELPKLIVRDVRVKLTDGEMKEYKKFERENVLKFATDDKNIIAINAAALCSKLSQYANGFVYDENHFAHYVNNCKIEALKELVEQAQENNVLIFYQFQEDADKIIKEIPESRKYRIGNDLKDWNDGKIHVLLAHPANLSYGLNLQYGGNIIIWFGTGWNSELYSQACARLYRQGQTKPVYIYRVVCSETVDERQLEAVEHKLSEQDVLMDYLKQIRSERKSSIHIRFNSNVSIQL